MPYRKGKLWIGQVRFRGRRKQKVFSSKSDALGWESHFKPFLKEFKHAEKKELKAISKNNLVGERPPIYENLKSYHEKILMLFRQKHKNDPLEEFKLKYQEMYLNPQNTIADLFDSIMTEIGLPVRYKNILDLAKESREKIKQKIEPKLRVAVFQRDNFTCQWCGEKAPDVKLHVDHIIPRSKGGLTEFRNLRTLCEKCNLGRRDFTFHQSPRTKQVHSAMEDFESEGALTKTKLDQD